MILIAFGIVSDSCPICNKLKDRLQKDFWTYNIDLEFVELSYDLDPEESVKQALEFGLTEIPSFSIFDEVFTKNYDWEKVSKVLKKIKKPSM